MTFQNILALVAQLLFLYEADQAALEAGQTVNTPQIQVGTIGGKPLYGQIALTTVKAASPLP